MQMLSRFVLLLSVVMLSLGAVQETEETTSGPGVNDEAPDFELKDHTGKIYRLSDYRGKKNVIVEFIRSGGW